MTKRGIFISSLKPPDQDPNFYLEVTMFYDLGNFFGHHHDHDSKKFHRIVKAAANISTTHQLRHHPH